jgi:hypothetical protein
MQAMKYGIFLVLGIAAQACGGGSDGDGDGGDGGDDDDSGGSSSSGGSTGNGGSSGKGGSASGGSSSGKGGSANGGSSNGGSSSGSANGGSSSGGSTGLGGTGGSSGSVCLFDVPECEEFFTCVFESACGQIPEAQRDMCISTFKQAFSQSACYPSETDLATACNMVKMDPSFATSYPDCQ